MATKHISARWRNVYTEWDEQTHVHMELVATDGPAGVTGREVHVTMDAKAARALAILLLQRADAADELNAKQAKAREAAR